MVGGTRDFLRVFFLFPLVMAACASGQAPVSLTTSGTTTSGTGGSDLGPCGMDCSTIETSQCTIAVCNTGQELGPLNTCVVVAAPKGTACDDGKFCTTNDTCDSGVCVGGTQNTCGMGQNPCVSVICYEETKSCDATPVNDGTACEPKELCRVDGVCKLGQCVGIPKDCSFSPLSECNKVACDPATGKCIGTPDPDKDDAPCVLTGDLCASNKTCKTGACQGGSPKDCSVLDVGCEVGVCDPMNGFCTPEPAPVGTTCSESVPECHVGICDVKGDCIPKAAQDGIACNDHNACTKADTCSTGSCDGTPVAGCQFYMFESFETCSNGWTFGGDWQCGVPTNVGPLVAHTGTGLIGTKLNGLYSTNQSFSTAFADSPTIDLTSAIGPKISFWAWDHTEGGTFDGWNLQVSTNGGQSFTTVFPESPPYNLTILGQPAWGGNHSLEGWKNYIADLSDFAGLPVILRFAFRSDGATVFPGVYVDDLILAEPEQIPLYIATSSPLADIYAGMNYANPITKTGGSNNVVWSKLPGGTNDSWLSIDPTTGILKGVPSLADVGPVSVTIHVEEATLPSNFADKTFTFTVNHAAYYTSFEGACPDGWTLTGDWECGVPINVGPSPAYVGTQCLATKIDAIYSDLQTFAGSTATSPDIDLTNVGTPILTFRMWVDTEGSTYDGFNLKISSDGGQSYSIVNTATPTYPLTIAGEPAWGGHQAGLGWQLVQADLSAYAGQIIRLQFSFQTDSSGIFPGVYIDDVFLD
jgi:hypothetical protein